MEIEDGNAWLYMALVLMYIMRLFWQQILTQASEVIVYCWFVHSSLGRLSGHAKYRVSRIVWLENEVLLVRRVSCSRVAL